MSVTFPTLRDAISAKKCVFCDIQMVPAPYLSVDEFVINDSFLTFGPQTKWGMWHQLSLETNTSSFTEYDTPAPVTFVFECPVHKYTSDIWAIIHNGKARYSSKVEGVLLADKNRIIFVQNLLVIGQTKIYSLPTDLLPTNYNQKDFVTIFNLKNVHPIVIDFVKVSSDSTKYFTKIRTYITFS